MVRGKVERLREWLAERESILICFSGGVDSSYLLAEAVTVLGPRAVAFTAVSPSLDPEERESARRLAEGLGARHRMVDTHELDDARYASNPINRCYFCKTEVYGAARALAHQLGIETVADGFNVDDRADHRPGRRAARELGVVSPLDALGFRKVDIRAAARALDLPVWDKPALACLASRFPYGTTITPASLRQVAAAEKAVRALGFRVVRVRHFGATARVEVGREELPRLHGREGELERAVRGCGFERVLVDPRGYRRGSLNVL